MTDWMVVSTESQAKLEDAMAKISKLEEECQRYRYALGIIAHDGYELSHEKIINQRDYFIKLAKKAMYPEADA